MRRWLMGGATLLVVGVLVFTVGRPLAGTAQPAKQAQPTQPLQQLQGDAFDQAFLTLMIAHHAMAVRMARPAAANATRQEVKDLANSIITHQTEEITQMRGWAKSWYGVDVPDPLAALGSTPGMDHSAMPGMVTGSQNQAATAGAAIGAMAMSMGGMDITADLWNLPPNRLEVVFLTLMVPHHAAAVEMAKLVPDRAQHQELKDLAGRIISDQTSEISQMNSWLASWYGL